MVVAEGLRQKMIFRHLGSFFKITLIFFDYSVKGATFAVLNFSNAMANHKATKKDVRQATKRRERNKYYGKTTRNAIRDLKALKTNGEATKEFPEVASMIDKLAKRGIIHKNKAANLKSKLAKKINTLAK